MTPAAVRRFKDSPLVSAGPGERKPSFGKSFGDFIGRPVENELHLSSKRQPRTRGGILRVEIEILLRAELQLDAFGALLLLRVGVHPLRAVLEEVFAGDIARVLHVVIEALGGPD